MRPRVSLVAGTLLALAALGCTSDDDPGDAAATTTTTTATSATTATTGGAAGSLSSFDDLDELATAASDAGFRCVLEYEGLEDETGTVSLCTIGDGQATLRIWDDPADVAELAASGTATELTVYGENWTIDVRDPSVASDLAAALGGTTG